MAKVKYDHVHQYKSLLEKSPVFRCVIEGCPHSINKAMLVGRLAQCPDCLLTFNIKPEHLNRRVVVCGCKLREKQAPTAQATSTINDLLAQVQGLNRKDATDDNKECGIGDGTKIL